MYAKDLSFLENQQRVVILVIIVLGTVPGCLSDYFGFLWDPGDRHWGGPGYIQSLPPKSQLFPAALSHEAGTCRLNSCLEKARMDSASSTFLYVWSGL